MGARSLGAVAPLLGMLLGLLGVPATPAVADDGSEPLRILLVGDSVTQGSAGDWTWRYRLWQQLTAAGVSFDFVGPRDDLYDNLTAEPGSQAYADPAFDRDHAARWGRWISQTEVPDVPIEQLVSTYHPDVVVEMLGVNDVRFGVAPKDVVDRLTEFVADVRSVDPDVDLVLGEATQTWWTGVPEFNQGLEALTSLATAGSAVTVATVPADYDMATDTWDNSHPNARGEVKISAEVADALAELGIGVPAARPLTLPEVGPRTGAVLTATPGDGQATLSWVPPPGADKELVWVRDVTAGDPWARLPFPVEGPTWTGGLLLDGHRYDFRLQPMKGDDQPEGAVYSNTVSVVPSAPDPAPLDLVGDGGRRCARLAWQAPGDVRRYRVEVRRASGWSVLGWTRRTSYVASGLPPTSRWTLRVQSWDVQVPGGTATVRVPRGRGTC